MSAHASNSGNCPAKVRVKSSSAFCLASAAIRLFSGEAASAAMSLSYFSAMRRRPCWYVSYFSNSLSYDSRSLRSTSARSRSRSFSAPATSAVVIVRVSRSASGDTSAPAARSFLIRASVFVSSASYSARVFSYWSRIWARSFSNPSSIRATVCSSRACRRVRITSP